MTQTKVLATERRGGALVEDVVFDGPDGSPVEAYLVRRHGPSPAAPHAGIVMWHWLDDKAPDGNRTQYLDEAADLAGAGAVCLLPQGRFPWSAPPAGSATDGAAIRAEVARLRAGLDLLAVRDDVDPARLGVVGHDFGGMYATLAAADDERVASLAVIAATPRWGDWFLVFWDIDEDRIDYLRAMRPLDPIERIGDVTAATLLQFGRRDFYIAEMTALEFHGAAPEGTDLVRYDAGHDMRLAEIRTDRRAFLVQTLGLAGGRPD